MRGVSSNGEQQLVCPAPCHWPWSRGRRGCLVSVCLPEPVRGSPGAAVSRVQHLLWSWPGPLAPLGFVSLMWASRLGQPVTEQPSPLSLLPSAPRSVGVERRVAASPPVGSASSLQRQCLGAGCRERQTGPEGGSVTPATRRFRACTRAVCGRYPCLWPAAGGRLCGPETVTQAAIMWLFRRIAKEGGFLPWKNYASFN